MATWPAFDTTPPCLGRLVKPALALTLSRCVDGAWEETACLAEEGRLCEEGACVDPWLWGTPTWSTCPDEPQGTVEALHEKVSWQHQRVLMPLWRVSISPRSELPWPAAAYSGQSIPRLLH